LPYIIMFGVPFQFKYNKLYQKIGAFVFIVPNAVGFLGNCVDFEFFKFTSRRMTGEIFNIIGIGDDFMVLLPQFLKDFWYILIIWLLFIIGLIVFFNKTRVVAIENKSNGKKIRHYILETSLFFVYVFLVVIGTRGGIQLKPISIINAGRFTNSKNVALVLNTPFSIIKTINKTKLEDYRFYSSDKEIEKVYSPIHFQKKTGEFNTTNVVIIIMEGFSEEYIGSVNKNLDKGRYKGYTPFLDSLIKVSLYFNNAYSNGKRSIDAIPAITSSIPNLMNNPYISSIYAGDNIYSIPKLLREKGYKSYFFHGGTDGTMGFDSYCKMAGFDKYYGRKEYNNDKDFDGKWGIFDEEFLQYCATNLNNSRQPFFAEIFTLSSHHPYKVPDRYNSKFHGGPLPIHRSIEYADYSLSRFFATASNMPWFKNTLFIITADHTSEASYPFYQSNLGIFSVPVLYYKSDTILRGVNYEITQHIDIMPSLMDYLNYDKPYIAFGKSVFDSSAAYFAINYLNNTYQLIEEGYTLQFDGKQDVSLYNITNDSLLTKNLLGTGLKIEKHLSDRIKAIIQSYNSRLINNKMIIKNN
jgi:phosphoglycerol transferase MdoB-like AlkP superfamily enzyme